MRRYEKYKSSGVEWLGEIPEHWEVKRVKDLTSIISKGTTPSTEGESLTDFGVRFIKAENIKENGIVSDEPSFFISEETNKLLSRSRLKDKDLLLVIAGATTGKIAVINEYQLPANTNQAVCFIRLKKTEVIDGFKYKYYFINSSYFQSLIWLYSLSSAQPNLPMAVLGRMSVYFPPFSEQTTIANYLDAKTSAIDRKIELLTAKTEKYNALRRSLINETVCRGLNPNAPLKDSGIEWIGKIPRHWTNYRMKDLGYLYSGLSGKAGDDFNQDDNVNNRDFIPFTNIFNNDIINPDFMGKVVVFENEKQNKVKKNDLFFLMSSEDYDGLGKSSLLSIDLNETYLNSFCKGFRITKKYVFPAFLNYQLQSYNFRKVMQIEGKGFTRLNLKSEKITDFNVFIPNKIEEQTIIVQYLNNQTAQIDTILTNISNQINKLIQLKKTLINDVVTGKIKVMED